MKGGGRRGGPIVVVSFTGNSGLTDYAVSFCREIAKRSLEVRLLTATSIEPRYRDMGFKVETPFRRSRHYPVDIFKFVRRVVALKPSVVIMQGPLKFPVLDAVAVRYLRTRGIGVAVVAHDAVPHNQKRLATAGLQHYYRAFPRVVLHSEGARETLRKAGVKVPILVVPHGRYDIFDVDGMSREAARAALGIDQIKTVALFFGNLEERKGLQVFVDAARQNADDSLLFLAAGQDFLTSTAPRSLRRVISGEEQVPTLRVDCGRVPHEEVQTYFKASDVVVLPYLEGTTSGVLKLALAFDIPVLATDVGDVREHFVGPVGWSLGTRPTPEGILAGIADRHLQQAVTVSQDLAWSSITRRVMDFLDESDTKQSVL